MKSLLSKSIQFFGSLNTVVTAMVLLMMLVVLCTLDQVNIGTFNAIDKYFRVFFVWAHLPVVGWFVPVFPGGGFVGLLLLLALVAEFIQRFSLRKTKIGIWIIHFGLIVLVLGEFCTGMFAVETQLAIEEGQTKSYSESPRHDELVVIDQTNIEFDDVYSIKGEKLKDGRVFNHPAWPFSLKIRVFHKNATFQMAPPNAHSTPLSEANQGMGTNILVQPLPPVSKDDERNFTTAFVEILKGNESKGVWLLSSGFGQAQSLRLDGKIYGLAIRPTRIYYPYSIALKDFKHDVYAGTKIPKNFSSLIQLNHPEKGENREFLIYMNHPLRYQGNTYYQASFGKNDTLSVLQVVSNPGRHLPYVAFGLMGIGLLIHFGLMLHRKSL